MADADARRDLWLVAAWPGMGDVGAGAVAYLLEQLGAAPVHELEAAEFFDVGHVEVSRGIARAARLPQSRFYRWSDPDSSRDLLLFLGDAQPASGGQAMCRRIIDYAANEGVRRVFTFAAMATQVQPSTRPRVFGAATDDDLLPRLREFEVELLKDGQISGLNGLLLASAAERGLPAACLLGELPFFAAGVRNPRASAAVLESFSRLAGITVDLAELREAGRQVEAAVMELLSRLREAGEVPEAGAAPGEAEPWATGTAGVEGDEDETASAGPEGEAEAGAGGATAGGAGRRAADEAQANLAWSDRERIEQLFDEVRQDRRAAVRLKSELDRLGVFAAYEDRFLDLFRRGE